MKYPNSKLWVVLRPPCIVYPHVFVKKYGSLCKTLQLLQMRRSTKELIHHWTLLSLNHVSFQIFLMITKLGMVQSSKRWTIMMVILLRIWHIEHYFLELHYFVSRHWLVFPVPSHFSFHPDLYNLVFLIVVGPWWKTDRQEIWLVLCVELTKVMVVL